jgi:hypothetical protein
MNEEIVNATATCRFCGASWTVTFNKKDFSRKGWNKFVRMTPTCHSCGSKDVAVSMEYPS